jgi:thiol-disulfide isomerase/thioredoxin
MGLSAAGAAAQTLPATQPAQEPATVSAVYPGLASAALVHAQLCELPPNVLLQAGNLTLTQDQIDAEIAKASPVMQPQLRKNAFYMLEQIATGQLLLAEAKVAAALEGRTVAGVADGQLIQGYLQKAAAGTTVSDAQIADFYAANREMIGNQELEAVKEPIRGHMVQQKQQLIVNDFVQAVGRRMRIVVSAPWVKQQADLAADNPVDRARRSGRASLVDFGSKGCIPCDKLAPILETLRTQYDGRANVFFVSVREEQILAARYGIESIPVQIFFDKDGQEVFRHIGFWPRERLEAKLAEMGVK